MLIFRLRVAGIRYVKDKLISSQLVHMHKLEERILIN